MQKLWQQLFTVWSMQKFKHIDTHPVTLDIYESLTKKFLSEQPDIPPDDYIEIRFEEIERDPTNPRFIETVFGVGYRLREVV